MAVYCDRVGCYHVASWRPILTLPLRRAELIVPLTKQALPHFAPPPARAALDLNLCAWHRKVLTISDLLRDEHWQQIVEGFQQAGLPTPDRARLTIEWERLAHGPTA